MIAAVVCTVSGVAVQSAIAQMLAVQYEKVLIPLVVLPPQPGAFGSLWATWLMITNPLANEVLAYPHFEGNVDPISSLEVPRPLSPGASVIPKVPGDAPDLRGFFLFVDSRFVDQIQITLRVQDLSRQTQTWGTAIPVVRERQFVNRRFSLNSIPTDSRFRLTLRVYSFDSSRPTAVKVVQYGIVNSVDSTPDKLLGSRIFSLRDLSVVPPNSRTALFPGFLEVSGLDSIGPAAAYDRVRLDIEPTDANTRIWAFISVTNNETQHVTVIAPSL